MNKHTFKRAVRQTVWQKTGGVCWYCGKQCQPFDGSFSVDHFIPKNKGGTHSIENLMPSCHSCNSVKGDRTIEEFRKLCSGIRFFSSTQKSVLQMLGYTDLDERIKKHTSTFKFWFEKQ